MTTTTPTAAAEAAEPAARTTEELAAILLRNPGKGVLIEVGNEDASMLETGTFAVFEGDEGVLTLFAQDTASAGVPAARREFLRLAVAELMAECEREPQSAEGASAAAHLSAVAEALGISVP